MKTLRRMPARVELEEDKLQPEFLNKLQVTMDDFENALKDVMPSAMREVYLETPDIHWSDIGGLDSVKKELQEASRVAIKISRPLHGDRLQHAKGDFAVWSFGNGKDFACEIGCYRK